jgi:N-acetylglucosamine-6-phosphate deacetylase
VSTPLALTGAAVFDGDRLLDRHAVVLTDGTLTGVVPDESLPEGAEVLHLGGGTLAPGFVDLQVNGGGAVMFNDAPTVATLRTIAEAHARLGATSILPTLITDRPDVTAAAIKAAVAAVAEGVPGIAGLHLEGPHLSVARKGAHDPALIRPMEDADLEALLSAAARLPALMVTVAPESVHPQQVAALAGAGVHVSIGHSDCTFDEAQALAGAGASCVTHLFNAMSQLGNREPGLVGATLALPDLSAGLIADLIHVHPEVIRAALAAKRGPGRVFLVSDAMAAAGSDIDHFTLNGRRIERRDGRLTLSDGTLAGADFDLATALRNLATVGVPAAQALAMATTIPGDLIGRDVRLRAGARADLLHLDAAGALTAVWQGGARVL